MFHEMRNVLFLSSCRINYEDIFGFSDDSSKAMNYDLLL